MTDLKQKIQNALDESRMLILGAQVLIGFQYRGVFEKGFLSLPRFTQHLLVGALGVMLIALALLIAPAAYHRIVEGGNDTEALHRFAIGVMKFALMPFSIGLGITLFAAAEKLTQRPVAAVIGSLAFFLSLYFWYLLERIDRRRLTLERSLEKPMEKTRKQSGSTTEIDQKIKHVLTEARVVLPGAQALLGFQFATMLMEGFDRLPPSSKYLHLISLMLIALAVIFLMTPAAYHRTVEQGENTERFHRFAGQMILMAMVPLALGVSGDFFVVVRKVAESILLASVAAGGTFLFFFAFWFAFPLYRRKHPESKSEKPIFIAVK